MPITLRLRFAQLALVAMLLLALLPTIGRLGAGTVACAEGGTMPAGAHQSMAMSGMSMHGMSMHDMAGMTPEQHRAHMAMMARMSAGAPAPKPARSYEGHDCPYCPLLSGLVSAFAAPWSPAASLQFAPWSVRAVVHRAVDAPVPALGSQGPPRVAEA